MGHLLSCSSKRKKTAKVEPEPEMFLENRLRREIEQQKKRERAYSDLVYYPGALSKRQNKFQ
jgi:hypothetical protein